MSGGLGALSMAWVTAEALLPLGWRNSGLCAVTARRRLPALPVEEGA